MKKLIIAVLLASTMLAAPAMAQTPGEDHHDHAAAHRDHREHRKEHREHRRDHREHRKDHHDDHHM